jgi:hypothetical protein
MSRWLPDWLGPRDDGDSELDALLGSAWEDGAAAIATMLDLEAGKAALLAGRHRPPAGPAGPVPGRDSGAVAAVCDETDALLALVTAECEPGRSPAHTAVMAHMFAAREFLVQLRAGLAARTVTRAQARHLTGGVEHALQTAAGIFGGAPHLMASLEGVQLLGLIGVLRGQLAHLAGEVERLFDEAGDAAPRVPAPR